MGWGRAGVGQERVGWEQGGAGAGWDGSRVGTGAGWGREVEGGDGRARAGWEGEGRVGGRGRVRAGWAGEGRADEGVVGGVGGRGRGGRARAGREGGAGGQGRGGRAGREGKGGVGGRGRGVESSGVSHSFFDFQLESDVEDHQPVIRLKVCFPKYSCIQDTRSETMIDLKWEKMEKDRRKEGKK